MWGKLVTAIALSVIAIASAQAGQKKVCIEPVHEQIAKNILHSKQGDLFRRNRVLVATVATESCFQITTIGYVAESDFMSNVPSSMALAVEEAAAFTEVSPFSVWAAINKLLKKEPRQQVKQAHARQAWIHDPIGALIQRVQNRSDKCVSEAEQKTAQDLLQWPVIADAFQHAVAANTKPFDMQKVCQMLKLTATPSQYERIATGKPIMEMVFEVTKSRHQDFMAVLAATAQAANMKWGKYSSK